MGKTLNEILPPPEEALKLEPEELAVFVLEYLNNLDHGSSSQLNRYNFTLDSNIEHYAGQRRKEIAEVLTEAWIWLEREGFIAPRPGTQGEWVFITRKGKKLRTRIEFEAYRRGNLLPSDSLDPILIQKVRPLFIRGDYETAVFQSFKEVEIRVREAAGLSAELIGVNLMRVAFDSEKGPLTDKSLIKAEREATAHLFAGALGLFKNPTSHRHVELNNPSEAAELILFANYLLREVDSRKEKSS